MGNRNSPDNETITILDGNENASNGRENNETILQPTTEQRKGKRGRPKGSKNKSSNTTNKETIILESEPEEVEDNTSNVNGFLNDATKYVKNSNAYKNKNKGKSKKFYSESEAQATADFIIETVQVFTTQLSGTDGSMNVIEQSLLQLSLPKYLETLEVDTVDKTSKFLYPVMGLMGVSLYGLRMVNQILEKRNEDNVVRDKQAEQMKQAYKEAQETTTQPDNTEQPEKMGNDIDWSKTKDKELSIRQQLNI